MESKQNSIAIIGAGPAGCICGYFASKNNKVTLFEAKAPLYTLLYTGGGRCNLAYSEYDFKELAKYYPRGEKFLFSIFSKFATADTIDFFEKIGVETYTQDDFRIFPTSNSAKEVREKLLNSIKKCKIIKEKVIKITPQELSNNNTKFTIFTDNEKYEFDKVVVAIGGHAGMNLLKNLDLNLIEQRPALTGLITKENFKPIQGLSLKQISAEVSFEDKNITTITDDMIFTHEGISGPLAYKISSTCARINYSKQKPLKLNLNFISENEQYNEQMDTKYLQELLNKNPKKEIKNLISEFIPKSLSEFLLLNSNIQAQTKCCDINAEKRNKILENLKSFEITIQSPAKDGEVVTTGGVPLKDINPQNMESKLIKGLYFCGEITDIDGYCGGFNLQNCWSSGYVCGSNI